MATEKTSKVPVFLGQGVSAAGKRVTLERVVNQYEGARPFLVVSYEKGRTLYTPYPRRARAIIVVEGGGSDYRLAPEGDDHADEGVR